MENMSQTTIFLSLNNQIYAINTSDYEHKWHINIAVEYYSWCFFYIN